MTLTVSPFLRTFELGALALELLNRVEMVESEREEYRERIKALLVRDDDYYRRPRA